MVKEILLSPGVSAILQIITCIVLIYLAVDLYGRNRWR